MPEYVVKRGKGIEKEEEAEEDPSEEIALAEEMKSVLEEKMQEAWAKPEARGMRRKLSKVAKTHWKPQIEEALQTTGYAKELEARAREIKYNEKVKKVWE